MNKIVFGDFETTGIPEWKIPSDDPVQPHIVQVAALMVDADTKQVIQTMNLVVKPDGFVIPEETIELHGISNEVALEVGVPEEQAISLLLSFCKDRKRVFYNSTFDNRIARIAAKRHLSEELQEQWKAGEYECAMILAKKVMGASKNQKLGVAYQHFMGKELEDAHSALADTNACMDVYFAAKAQQLKDAA